MNIFAVGLGGAIGALCRYFLGQFIPKLGSGFPFGTFSVNLIGCFMIGAIVGFVGMKKESLSLLYSILS